MTIFSTKIHIGLAAMVCLTAIAMAIGGVWSVAKAQPSSVATQLSATATSTNTYMTAGTATTTYQIDSQVFSNGKVANMQQIDQASIFVLLNASSSVAILAYQIQYSNNGIDWYGEGSNLATANANIGSTTNNPIQLATTTLTHLWTPTSTGTSTMPVIVLNNTPAQHARIVFSVPPGSAPLNLYFEVDLKKNPSTP